MARYTPRHSSTDLRPKLWVVITRRFLATIAVVLVSALILAGFTAWRLNNNLQSHTLSLGKKFETNDAPAKLNQPPAGVGSYESGFNMLVMASDTRAGQEAVFGQTDENLADVIMLVTVTPDHHNMSVVSFPRDLMVDAPQCTDPSTGETYDAGFIQINSTLSRGGASCVVSTVENVTGLKIDFAAVVDFNGVIEMSNAVGGVDVCLTEPISDPYTGTFLDAGNHTLQGLAATQFLRTRHGVGDGSDLGRIGLQQVFLSSLVRKIKSDDTLTNPVKLYSLAEAATQNVSLSKNLANPTTLVSMAKVFQDVNLDQVVFLRVPVVSGDGEYANRVLLDTEKAGYLFSLLKANTPITLTGDNTGSASVKQGEATTPTPTPTPTATPTQLPDVAHDVPTVPATDTPSSSPAPVNLDGVIGQKSSDVTCTK